MELQEMLDGVYEAMDGSEVAERYSERHGIASAAVLTITDDEAAGLIAEHLAEHVRGKVVVELGGGIGLLSLHLAQYAKRVYCIDANPAWAWGFVGSLFAVKPKNVSYLFGAASEFHGMIVADVALFCTHSGVEAMRTECTMFAPEVIDVYGEIIAQAPERFDQLAVALRKIA